MARQLGHTGRIADAVNVRLTWSVPAKDDLREIRAFIHQENPHAAKKVAAAIKATANPLRRSPYLGHGGEDGTREILVVPYPSYLLVYDVDETAKTVTILSVWKQWLPR